ncbi:glycosyltransferase family 2 protein [Rubellimicrobium arenae]|uniref:glycosyltransferase family 2 protein n=1 Tax=Rubellimicrobium arenae TaxID=2817372 RepID=UPI001B302A81|nr:glycosyltransferase family 2 protein [Rubellimicrobium arenae]
MTYALDVLMPHYCHPLGLKQSLDSVARQTWRGRLRVIVVDDGSPEADFNLAKEHCDEFRRTSGFDLLLLRNETNLGRPKTRNRLLDAVEATHVAWLDAEDVWYPEKLALQFEHLARLEYQGVDINRMWVTCNYHWRQYGRTTRVAQITSGDQLREILLGAKLRAYLWTLLGTAESFRIAGRFDERLPRLQDLDYFISFVRAGGRLSTPPGAGPLCRYYKSDVGRAASDVRDSYKLILAKNRPVLRRYPPELASKLHFKANWLGARFARANGHKRVAAAYLVQAAIDSPREAIHTLRWIISKRFHGGK